MHLRLDKRQPHEPKPPFPIRMFIVGEDVGGAERVRYNLDIALLPGQQLVIRDVTLTLEA